MSTKTVNYEKCLTKAKFRVKIRSLADEARVIRHEERRMKGWATRRGLPGRRCAKPLADHRRQDVRAESRAALLARAYYLGIPYRVLEPTGRTPVRLKRVAGILKSLANQTVSLQAIQAWVNAGKN